MIHKYFRASGACEEVQGLSNLSTSLQNDDVQFSMSDGIMLRNGAAELMMRIRNFRVLIDLVETGSVTKSQ